jgi:CBS domain-containing protein
VHAVAFIYPESRYYYDWYGADVPPLPQQPGPTDSSIKAAVVSRLRENLFTKDCDLRVDVKRGVVILAGVVDSRLAKRSAGDDCWDTLGVTDVSNQLEVAEVPNDLGPQPISDIMTTGVVTLEAEAPLQAAAAMMRDSDVGSVVEMSHGNVVGIVTDRDIVVRAVAEGRDVNAASLNDIATDRVITMAPEDPVELAAQLMREHAVRRIVVVDDEVPVGVVSMGDMARRRDPGSVLADVVSAPANA